MGANPGNDVEGSGAGYQPPGSGRGVGKERSSDHAGGDFADGNSSRSRSRGVPNTLVLESEEHRNAGDALHTYSHAGSVDGATTAPHVTHPLDAQLGAGGVPAEHSMLTTDQFVRRSLARRKLGIRALTALLILLTAAATFFYSPPFGPANEPARMSDVSLAEVQPYGVNTFLHKEVEGWKRQKTLELAHDMGASWVRQQFPWAEIEYRTDPNRPYWDVKNNQNAWDKFDAIVNLAEQNNLRLIARIDNAPQWSHPLTSTLKSPPDSAHLPDFGNFVEKFVERYKGRIAAIQVWNEPNLTAEWAVQDPQFKGTVRPVDPREYMLLLKTAYAGAKRADPNMIVLAAPLATNNETLAFRGNLNEIDYLQGMYDAGAGAYFDVMSANAYGKSAPPEDAPSLQKLNFRRVELLRAVMERNGDTNKAVWFNEYGWNASPATITDLPWGRVSPEEQADYTVRGIQYAREHWPWAGVFTIWYLRQVGDTPPSASEYYFGMVNPDFIVSPVYREVAAAAHSTQKVAVPGTWGPLSPPVQASPRWNIKLDSAAPGGAYIAPSSLGDTLDITFTGTDLKLQLVAMSASTVLTGTIIPARYYVTVDGKADKVSPSLPRDEQGAYIAVPVVGHTAEVELVHGLGEQFRTTRHTLQIKVAAEDGGEVGSRTSKGGRAGGLYAPTEQHVDLPGIGAVTVEAHSSYLLFTLFWLVMLSGIAFSVWALLRGPHAG